MKERNSPLYWLVHFSFCETFCVWNPKELPPKQRIRFAAVDWFVADVSLGWQSPVCTAADGCRGF